MRRWLVAAGDGAIAKKRIPTWVWFVLAGALVFLGLRAARKRSSDFDDYLG